jgi:uncharacterized membrane protein
MNRERTVRLLYVTVLLVFVVFAGGVANLISNPPAEEEATEFYLLTNNGSGELVAGGYSDQVGTSNGSVYLGIEHELKDTQQFTVIVQVQQITDIQNDTTVVERRNVESIPIRVEPETATLRRVELNLTSDRQYSRVAFLLYPGSPPSDPSIRNAHRSTYVWVDPETVDRA